MEKLSSRHWYAHISSVVGSASQRLCFLRRNLRGSPYRMLLNNIIDVNIDELDIQLLKDSDSRKTRGYHPNKIVRQRASDKNSPLWTSTVFRTTPQWNNLSPASLEAGSITILVGGFGRQPYTTRLVRRPAIYTATQP